MPHCKIGFGGILDDLGSALGLTGDILTAVTSAELEPTSANINAVVKAYAANGQTPSPTLMGQLIQANAAKYPNDLYSSSVLPVLIGGAVILWLFFRR